MTKVITLTGPACVGKGPLQAAMQRYRTDIRFGTVPVIRSLESRKVLGYSYIDHASLTTQQIAAITDPKTGIRPTDRLTDFYPASTILSWASDRENYIIGDCRGFPQAIRRTDIEIASKDNPTLFCEAYYTLARQFLDSPFVRTLTDVQVHNVFLSPISETEMQMLLEAGINPDEYVPQMMMHKQLVRNAFLGKETTEKDLVDFRQRAMDTLIEISTMAEFKHVIVNHDGEGNPNWNQVLCGKAVEFCDNAQLSGDAARTLSAFSRIFLLPDGNRRLWEIVWRDFPQGQSGGGGVESTRGTDQFPSGETFFGTREEAVIRTGQVKQEQRELLGDYFPWVYEAKI